MEKIFKLWKELKSPEAWSNEIIIRKINELVQWIHEHEKEKNGQNV